MAAVAYTPRDPAAAALYTVVREHVETFRVEAARLRDGQGLPRFVDAEFSAFLRCGFLASRAAVALVLDGVLARSAGGHVRFHPAPAPSVTDMAEILATLVSAVQRLLSRHGLTDEGVADPRSVTRDGRGSISTQPYGYRPASATASSVSAATRFDRPWPVTICTSRAPAMSPSSSGVPGRMAPRISCSRQWRFWRAWPSSCPARA